MPPVGSSQARTQKLFAKLNSTTCQMGSGASPEAVHDLRTTARRIETLLSTHGADGHGGTGKLARQLAKLRRRAGKLRDVDVHLDALKSVQLNSGTRDKVLLRDHLKKVRSRREEKLARTVDTELSKGLQKRLKRALSTLPARFDAASHKNYTGQALTKFQALVAEYPPLTEKTLHNFRIACKRIRYLAEMSGETPEAERVVSILKQIQDAIGEWHDWLTLGEVATKVVPRTASPLVAALRTQTKAKYNEALRTTAEAKRELLALRARRAPVATLHRDAVRNGGGAKRRPSLAAVHTSQKPQGTGRMAA